MRLQTHMHCTCALSLVLQAGLTPDELLLQATRAWNVAVRERLHDEELWLDFAAFQHSVAQQQPQRGRYAPAEAQQQQRKLGSLALTSYHQVASAVVAAKLASMWSNTACPIRACGRHVLQ